MSSSDQRFLPLKPVQSPTVATDAPTKAPLISGYKPEQVIRFSHTSGGIPIAQKFSKVVL